MALVSVSSCSGFSDLVASEMGVTVVSVVTACDAEGTVVANSVTDMSAPATLLTADSPSTRPTPQFALLPNLPLLVARDPLDTESTAGVQTLVPLSIDGAMLALDGFVFDDVDWDDADDGEPFEVCGDVIMVRRRIRGSGPPVPPPPPLPLLTFPLPPTLPLALLWCP